MGGVSACRRIMSRESTLPNEPAPDGYLPRIAIASSTT